MFDDRNNPMTPTHANKEGVRHRYYVAHALLQDRKDQTGFIGRISASYVEQLVIGGAARRLQSRLGRIGPGSHPEAPRHTLCRV
jgi:site-specific DNA recombinase